MLPYITIGDVKLPIFSFGLSVSAIIFLLLCVKSTKERGLGEEVGGETAILTAHPEKTMGSGRFICYELFCSCKPYFPQPLPQLLPVLPGYLLSFFFFFFFPYPFSLLFLSFLPSFNIFVRPFRGREGRNK
jgi:hypothetical protein